MSLSYLVAVLIVLSRTESATITRHSAAVVTNGAECSAMASEILREGGSAADAAITALLCEGVTCPQGSGIGGGVVMTIFTAATGEVETLNARDMAPGKAHKEMFDNVTRATGGRAIAVPGEIKGFWELHQKYGKLKWSRLFRPVIDLCRRGHVVTPYFAGILQMKKQELMNRMSSLHEIFVDPATDDVYKEGDHIKRLKLSDTLEEIAENGPATLYENGTLAQRLIDDIQRDGGIMTVEDLMAYEARWNKPISQKVAKNKTLHTMPLPGSGSLILFILNVLNDYLPDGPVLRSFQRIAETYKFAFVERLRLGDSLNGIKALKNVTSIDLATQIRHRLDDERTHNDPEYYGGEFDAVSDHGTVHINVLAPNGDAIAATSSINDIFGSRLHSNQTGIILNDSMNDFAFPSRANEFGYPPGPENFIAPFKRPLSSKSPTILVDEHGQVEMLIGSAGGARIPTAVSYVLMRYLQFNESFWDAVHAPRIHHQLYPMEISFDDELPEEIVTGLKRLGHVMVKAPNIGFASVTAIGRDGDKLVPVYHPIRGGSSSVF